MEFDHLNIILLNIQDRFINEYQTLLQKEQMTFISFHTASYKTGPIAALEIARNNYIHSYQYFEQLSSSVIQWSIILALQFAIVIR